MKIIQTVQFSFIYEGSDHVPTSVIAGVTIGTDDDSGMVKQYGTRYTLSPGSQTKLGDVVSEVIQAIKSDEGIS